MLHGTVFHVDIFIPPTLTIPHLLGSLEGIFFGLIAFCWQGLFISQLLEDSTCKHLLRRVV